MSSCLGKYLLSFNLIGEIVEVFSLCPLELASLKPLFILEKINLLLADSSLSSEQKKAPWATVNARSHMEPPMVNDDQVRDLENQFIDSALSCGKSVWSAEY